MKMLTLLAGGQLHPGVMIGADVLDLTAAAATVPLARTLPATLKTILASATEGVDVVRRVAALAALDAPVLRAQRALIPFADATLAPVIPDAHLVVCASMNSKGHLAEMGDIAPSEPVAFLKVSDALVGSGHAIVLPPGHGEMVDWEGEFCAVIGTSCHRVAEDDALDYVAGYTLLNDVSAREFVKPFVTAKGGIEITAAWERNVLGKNFPTFCPLGPAIATKDEFADPFDYHMETLVNGDVMQSSTSADLVFSIARFVAYYSQFYKFVPGDIISMGSPPGVGMARTPPRFLTPGDVVEIREARIGGLINTVARATP